MGPNRIYYDIVDLTINDKQEWGDELQATLKLGNFRETPYDPELPEGCRMFCGKLYKEVTDGSL